jgi:hypothetical protein
MKLITRVGVVAGTLLAVVVTAPSPVSAHHGWGAYQTERPLYLSGRVTTVDWRDPHVEAELDVSAGVSRPEDLSRPPLPEMLVGVGGGQTVPRATVPDDHAGRWRLELAPAFSQESKFGLRRDALREGDVLSLVGYRSRTDDRELRPELVILPDGGSVSQRSVALPRGDDRAEPAVTEPGEVVPEEAAGEGAEADDSVIPMVTLAAVGVIAIAALLVVVVRRRSGRSG